MEYGAQLSHCSQNLFSKMRVALRVRQKFASRISRRLLPERFSIISDDCWGGQLYRQIHLSYATPTVGLWIRPGDYLDYIGLIEEGPGGHDLEFIQSDKPYPVASVSGIRIHFMHFDNEDEARDQYQKRWERVHHDKILFKIDFGKPGYRLEDIERWNDMKLAHSVAVYPSEMEIPPEGVHNGIEIPDWVLDGAKMFDVTRKYFDVFEWVRSGEIDSSVTYRLLNFLIFDPTVPRRVVNRVDRNLVRPWRKAR